MGREAALEIPHFPATIGPFAMSDAGLARAFNAFYRQHEFPKPDPRSNENSMAGLDPAAAGLGTGDIVFCQISPLHKLTLDIETKVQANIPVGASYFAWAYPLVMDGSITLSGARGPAEAFLEFGGYIYFNEAQDVVGTNSIRPAEIDTPGLMFGHPQPLPPAVGETLTKQGRFQETTLEMFVNAGATHFAWIRPGEFSENVACDDGCFAYKFSGGAFTYFPVVTKPAYTKEMLETDLDEQESWVVLRNAAPRPVPEVVTVFDRAKPFAENMAQSNASDLGNRLSTAGLKIGKRSNPSLALSYDAWERTADKGTPADPWVLTFPSNLH